MKKIIVIAGCSVSSVVCCLASWKICEAGLNSWPWFLITGILILFLAGGIANSTTPSEPEEKYNV
jgi:hypothetical protein